MKDEYDFGFFVWVAGFVKGTTPPPAPASAKIDNRFVGQASIVGGRSIRPIIQRLSLESTDVEARHTQTQTTFKGAMPGIWLPPNAANGVIKGQGINLHWLNPALSLSGAKEWINTMEGQEFSKGADWVILLHKTFEDEDVNKRKVKVRAVDE